MKENEIQIGDWVRYRYNDRNGHETVLDFRVDQLIRRYNLEMCVYSDTGDKGYASQIEPIPLTAEILEKNGFEKLDFSHFQIGDRRLVLDADGRWDGPLSWHWVVTEMDTNAKGQPVVLDYYIATINYVHELQHALRLCGIEKEITL